MSPGAVQLTLGGAPAAFDGPTYVDRLDRGRLSNNLQRVLVVLLDHEWHTLEELRRVGGSAADSRLRDLRKERFGGFDVRSERHPDLPPDSGVWVYRLWPPVTAEQLACVLPEELVP